MREIKFRAWDTKRKKMWSPEEMGKDQLTLMPDGRGFINVDGTSTELSQFATNLIPLQFTGLKDKNGKGTNEAYEDDIVICSFNSYPKHRFKGVIKYNGPELYLACFWEEIDGEQCSFPVGDNNRSLVRGWSIDEILGNIHTTPKLMEQGNE